MKKKLLTKSNMFINKNYPESGHWGNLLQHQSVSQFSHSVMSDSLRPHESQHARPPCPWIEVIYDKLSANIILNGEKPKAFSLRSGTRQGCPLLSRLFNIVLEVLSTAVRKERNKRNLNWKRRSHLFADDMILHIENRKDATRKLIKLISEFGKVAGYKINTQKSHIPIH